MVSWVDLKIPQYSNFFWDATQCDPYTITGSSTGVN